MGAALQETLTELVEEGKLTEEQVVEVLLQFDLQTNAHLKHPFHNPLYMGIEGDVITYTNAENVWRWQLRNCNVWFNEKESNKKAAPVVVKVGNTNVVATDFYPGRIGGSAGRKKAKLSTKNKK
jgi:hypothetical protein